MPKDERIIAQNDFISQAEKDSPYNGEEDFYSDEHIEDASLKRMGWGLWLAENRKKIIKIFIGFLIAISAFFFSFTIYNLVIYFKFGNPANQIVESNLNIGAQKQTEDLLLSAVSIFKSGDKNDLVFQVKNPNSNFSAFFDYCFKSGEEEIACDQSFVFPGEEKYVSTLGLKNGFNSASVYLKKITWKRLDVKNIPDFKAFKEERLSFLISDQVFSAAASGISSNIDLNLLEFSILNNSPYGYYQLPLDILIFNSGNLVGVNRHIINNFISGDLRQVRMSWSGDLRGAKDVLIVPSINIFDESIFLKYGSGT